MPQQNTVVQIVRNGEVIREVDESFLRHLPVDPSAFAAIRDELGLSNKQTAEAIGRTLSRVSELTKTKGASMQVLERFETDLRAWAEAHPKTEEQPKEAAADTK